MKYVHTLKQDLNKTVINIGFAGAAIMTCILCFTASVYRDNTNAKSYSVFEAFFSFDRNFIETHDEFASIRLFRIGLSGYITMFIPIIVAFPFMVSFCAERNNGLMRFTISRSGNIRYYLSKFSASFLLGGEQQRIELARLMVKKCDIILADEPTSSLDKANADKIMSILKTLNTEQGKTVIMVTHNEELKTREQSNRVIRDSILLYVAFQYYRFITINGNRLYGIL